MSLICGPLFQLRWFGTICPCLEKAEDTPARQALVALSGCKVQWHRTSKDKSSGSSTGFLGMFHKSSNGGGSSSSGSVEAVLDFYDSLKGPEIHITPCPIESNDDVGGEITMKQSAGFKKVIPLKKVDKVVAASSGSGWGGGSRSSSVSASASTIVLQSETEGHDTETLVRLSLLCGNENGGGTTTTGWDVVQLNNQRTQVIEHWTRLIEWDGRRRSNLADGEEEDEIDAGLKHRAQTAAHFAKREIEMRQHKREREERKARYIKASGGLKYTALAMANRAEE